MGKKITIKVLPRSAKNEIVNGDTEDGLIKVKLTASPVDGEANEALIKFLSDFWDIPKSKIRIVKGKTSRNKIIEIG
ncbi:MAG: DUF167 domain-containing protein [Candidatus Magasanikbacteria bacterium]|jgi:uncharacterized protein (TIGR00251 family)|nr:DUF167 domain-containing protein [Candidatus Magasanikbacteria bacterium]